MTTPEERLAELGWELPAPPSPVGTYVPAVAVGNLLYVSGQGPKRLDGSYTTGLVGVDLTVEEAYEHARLVGLTILAAVKQDLGTLSKIKRVVKVLGMVAAVPGFQQHPEVINGCSDLFVSVFGEAGKHARSAVGMGSLPRGISVEIEAIFQI